MLEDSVRYAKATENPNLSKMEWLLNEYNTKWWLEMPQINETKRFFERNNKFSYGRDMTAWEKTAWATNIDSNVRDWQMKLAEENGFTNLKELNKEIQASKFIMDKLAKNENGRLGNNAVTITDWIVAAPAMVDPTFLWWLVAKKVLWSNWFAKNYAKIVNKINSHKTIANKVADLQTISKIQDEKSFKKWLEEWQLKQPALPEKVWVPEWQWKVIDTKKIIVWPEWRAVREWQILEINKQQNATSNISSNSDLGNTKIQWETPVNKETTTQLKATVKAPEDSLYAEARKYKSAEEFVKDNIFVKEKNGFRTRIKNDKWYADYYIDDYDWWKELIIDMIETKETWKWYWDRIMQELENIAIDKKVDRISLHAYQQWNVPTDKLVNFYEKHWYTIEAGSDWMWYEMIKEYDNLNYWKVKNLNKSQLKQIREEANKWLNPKTKNDSISRPVVRMKDPEELYHTSTKEIWKLTDDKVLWTTPDSKYTLKYGKEGSRNTYKINSEWLNILDWTSKKWIDIIESINKKLWDKWFSAWVLSDDIRAFSIDKMSWISVDKTRIHRLYSPLAGRFVNDKFTFVIIN